MKTSDLRQKSDKDLRQELVKQQDQLAELAVKQRTAEHKKVHEFAVSKNLIAQIKTVLRERQLMNGEEENA